MDDLGIGRTIRALRQRRGWRRADLAAKVGCSQSLIAQLELGRIDGTTLRTLRRVLEAFEVRSEISLHGRIADIERLADAEHADLVAGATPRLQRLSWLAALEVTYSGYGERGSIDILAVLPSVRAVLVLEAKTELGSIELLGRKLDEKARLAPRIVRRLNGWDPACVGRVLLVAEASRMRLTFAATPALGLLFPDEPERLRAWLRAPTGTISAAWFLSGSSGHGRKRVIARRIRVSAAQPSTTEESSGGADSATTTASAQRGKPAANRPSTAVGKVQDPG